MDLRSLNTFIQVAELRNFTRAGEKLGYSQPTISFQIKQLEQELGIKLFDRIGHTVRLTDEGRGALVYAQQICHMCEDMVQGDTQRLNPSGVVRLAMADSLCTPLILGGFESFRRNYPEISLTVTTGGTPELFRLLDHNEVDIVCTLDSHIYDTNYIIANEEHIGVHFVAAADHPLVNEEIITFDMLRAHSFLLTEKGMSYRRVMDEWLAQNSVEIQPVLELGNADLICKLVENGLGVSLLPDYVTESSFRSGRVVRLDVLGFVPDIWKQVLHHRDKWVSVQMQSVIDHLSDFVLNKA